MNNNKHYPIQLLSQFLCPQCSATKDSGFNFASLQCNHCGSHYFYLGDIPCLFPTGTNHKLLWQYQLAAMKNIAQQGLASIEESLSRYDLLPTTRQRLVDIYNSSKQNTDSISSLMQDYGIQVPEDYQPGQFNPGDLSEYFDLVLRDWGWDNTETPNRENAGAFERVMNAVKCLPSIPKKILVMGAGAGRLSWDIHTKLKPDYTVVLDSNPLLLAVANSLIHERRSLTFGEFKNFPQINFPTTQTWTLNPPKDDENMRKSWFPMGANAWQLPFSDDTFDLIITPWFIDVNGGDVRDLIGIVSKKLATNGTWINSGPLLFTRHLPVQLKYSPEEIKEFIGIAGFNFDYEHVENTGYLLSPLEARFREEQVWTFSVRKNNFATSSRSKQPSLPDWLVLHHIPIPAGNYFNTNPHPLIEAIISLVDGKRTVNDICFEIGPNIPEGVAVKDVVVTIFGQLLNGQNA